MDIPLSKIDNTHGLGIYIKYRQRYERDYNDVFLNFKTIAQIFINPPTAKIKVTDGTASQHNHYFNNSFKNAQP